MHPLPHEPRTLREIVESDLRRAARLVIKVQDEIDPQWRIATRSGDWSIATTLPADDAHGRKVILRALGTFMVWKEAIAFTLASEIGEPDSVWCGGVSRGGGGLECHVCVASIRRSPRPWTDASFRPIEWLPATTIDPVLVALLPSAPRQLTPKDVSAMVKWFGKAGRFPAVNLASGEVGA